MFCDLFSAEIADGDSIGVAKRAVVQTNMTFKKSRLSAQHSNNITKKPEQPTDPWAIFRALRDAHTYYGLRAGQLQTLQAMLSFLKPGQGETVFASNSELCRRIGGIDERTLRRHIDRFVKLGFIQRHNSPNHKRYRVSASDGTCLSFGLSLAPFFERAHEILETAHQHQQDKRDRLFIHKRILSQLARIDEDQGASDLTAEFRKALRRKLNLTEYQALFARLADTMAEMSTAVDALETSILSANDGQNARQLSMSKKISIDLEREAINEPPKIGLLTNVCEEACSFSQHPIKTWNDVEAHARTLAPMMGINSHQFQAAREKLGVWKASSAIFILLQMGSKVKNFAAYFNSLTVGVHAPKFNPESLLNRMAQRTVVGA